MGDFTVVRDEDFGPLVKNIRYFEGVVDGSLTPDSRHGERVSFMNKYLHVPEIESLMGSVERKVASSYSS